MFVVIWIETIAFHRDRVGAKSRELRRLIKSVETNTLPPLLAQEDINGTLKDRCYLARLTALCLNLSSGTELWHRGMVDGVVPRSSIVELEAKRAHS